MKYLGLLFALLALGGCASYPDSVSVPEQTVLVEFEQENKAEVNQVGATARWSGVIAKLVNNKSDTVVDILYYPAKSNGRPITSGEPKGRFRAQVKGFLDPEVYKKGKSVTALGSLAKKQIGKIGEYEYEYPTISNAKIFLWPKLQQPAKVDVNFGWHGYYPRWYWYNGYRYPYIIGQGKNRVPTAKEPTKNNNK